MNRDASDADSGHRFDFAIKKLKIRGVVSLFPHTNTGHCESLNLIVFIGLEKVDYYGICAIIVIVRKHKQRTEQYVYTVEKCYYKYGTNTFFWW